MPGNRQHKSDTIVVIIIIILDSNNNTQKIENAFKNSTRFFSHMCPSASVNDKKKKTKAFPPYSGLKKRDKRKRNENDGRTRLTRMSRAFVPLSSVKCCLFCSLTSWCLLAVVIYNFFSLPAEGEPPAWEKGRWIAFPISILCYLTHTTG